MKYFAIYGYEGSNIYLFTIVDQEVWDWIHSEEEKVPQSIRDKWSAFIATDIDCEGDEELFDGLDIRDRAYSAPPVVVNGKQSRNYVKISNFINFIKQHDIKIEDECQF